MAYLSSDLSLKQNKTFHIRKEDEKRGMDLELRNLELRNLELRKCLHFDESLYGVTAGADAERDIRLIVQSYQWQA